MRKTAIITVIISLSLLLAGCGLVGFIPARKAKAARLLKEKYGEEFIIDDYRGQVSFMDGYYTVIAHAKAYPAVTFSAGVGTDDESLSDTYVCERLMARKSAEMSESLGRLTGDRYIFMQPFTPYTTINDPNTSLETFMEEAPKQEFTVYVNYVPDKNETAEDIYDGLAEMITALDVTQGYVAVYICDNKTLNKIQKYVERHDILYDSYDEIVEGRFAGLMRYEKGVLIETKYEFAKSVSEKSREREAKFDI